MIFFRTWQPGPQLASFFTPLKTQISEEEEEEVPMASNPTNTEYTLEELEAAAIAGLVSIRHVNAEGVIGSSIKLVDKHQQQQQQRHHGQDTLRRCQVEVPASNGTPSSQVQLSSTASVAQTTAGVTRSTVNKPEATAAAARAVAHADDCYRRYQEFKIRAEYQRQHCVPFSSMHNYHHPKPYNPNTQPWSWPATDSLPPPSFMSSSSSSGSVNSYATPSYFYYYSPAMAMQYQQPQPPPHRYSSAAALGGWYNFSNFSASSYYPPTNHQPSSHLGEVRKPKSSEPACWERKKKKKKKKEEQPTQAAADARQPLPKLRREGASRAKMVRVAEEEEVEVAAVEGVGAAAADSTLRKKPATKTQQHLPTSFTGAQPAGGSVPSPEPINLTKPEVARARPGLGRIREYDSGGVCLNEALFTEGLEQRSTGVAIRSSERRLPLCYAKVPPLVKRLSPKGQDD